MSRMNHVSETRSLDGQANYLRGVEFETPGDRSSYSN
jgi:hypothetical protein